MLLRRPNKKFTVNWRNALEVSWKPPNLFSFVFTGQGKNLGLVQIHDLANERPNRLDGFSTGSSKLTFMFFCGYQQMETRESVEMVVEKGKFLIFIQDTLKLFACSIRTLSESIFIN